MKIVFVVYNLAFISNWIERLIHFMEDDVFYVLHIANLQRKEPKRLNGVKYIDVSYRSGGYIRNMIRLISPDLCLIFNFRSLFEQLVLRICVENNIKNAYLEHGIVSMNTTKFKTNKIKREFSSTIIRQVNFLCKYMGFICHSKHPLQEWNIVRNVYLKGLFRKSPFDHYFLYSQRSYDKLSKIYDLCDDSVYSLVGYPIFNDEEEKKQSVSRIVEGGGVLYVHQPFISDKLTDIDYEEEKKYLLNLANVLKNRYSRFAVLLHPRENLTEYRTRYKDTNIHLIQSPNNYMTFADKDLIIGHYSTALLYALFFDKRAVVIDYPHTKMDPVFLEVFDYVPYITDLADDKTSVSDFSSKYLLGIQNTYEYIAKALQDYAKG